MREDHNYGSNFIESSAAIVVAYLSNNKVPPSEVAALIGEVHQSISGLRMPVAASPPSILPAVAIKKSITPDYLVCLDDGLQFKSMKRHLAGLGMTPAEYRVKWGLPPDYPMIAPSYATKRSQLAKANGLGRKPEPTQKVKSNRKKRLRP